MDHLKDPRTVTDEQWKWLTDLFADCLWHQGYRLDKPKRLYREVALVRRRSHAAR